MSLRSGTKLGPYEIHSALGAGGMGEVYRATDTNLKRQVALKVLPASFAGDADRLARFQREAEVLAALNHPHIAQIFGLERSEGTTALVMELVEGEDLSQRIARGPLPLDEALPIARQIAEALEAAHEQGIIHRDLKPANVKVRPDGTVKVLDFGLAKAMEPATGAASREATHAATITTPAMTQAGMILGTAAYMAPEQAKGRALDKRADLWAFGCVLFEMLTARRAFAGDDVADTMVAVLSAEPDWTVLPPGTPAPVTRLLRRCLTKDRTRRLADAADARLDIEEALTAPAPASPVVREPVRQPLWRRMMPLAATALAGAAIAAAVMALRVQPSTPAGVMRFVVALPEGQQWTANWNSLALSPDGRQLAYSADDDLYIRSLDDPEPRLVARASPGLIEGILSPTFSPDGQHLAYFDYGDSTIRRVGVGGGNATSVSSVQIQGQSTKVPPFGITWSADTIYFGAAGAGIQRVPAAGGAPETVARVEAGEVADAPMLLPDGEHLLFTIATGTSPDRWNKARIVVESLTSHERKTVIEGGGDGRWLASGHLTYAVAGVLYAVPFDLKSLTAVGSPVPVVEGVARNAYSGSYSGIARVAFADVGTMVYVAGPKDSMGGHSGVGLFNRQGRVELLRIPPGPWDQARFSPDGTRIALGWRDGETADIWVYEVAGANSMRRLTLEGQGHNRYPIWSADGQSIAFQSDREGDRGIFWQRADGTRPAERLTRAEDGVAHVPETWAPDGQHFLYHANRAGSTTLWAYSMKQSKASRFGTVNSPESTLPGAAYSPDGRWVAYASRQGRASSAIYVEPFPATGAKYQISSNTEDGHHPSWSSDGTELFYTPGPGGYINAVKIATRPAFTFAESVRLPRPFRNRPPGDGSPYDVSRDGRFLGLTTEGLVLPQYQFVVNWFEELRQRVPVEAAR